MPPWPPSRDAAALSAHPYKIGFSRKELLEQATRRLSLDRRSAPTDTDVDILIPRPGPAWAVPCSAVVVDQGFYRRWPCLAGRSAENGDGEATATPAAPCLYALSFSNSCGCVLFLSLCQDCAGGRNGDTSEAGFDGLGATELCARRDPARLNARDRDRDFNGDRDPFVRQSPVGVLILKTRKAIDQ